ncbi:PLP-dependent aminotransferase family protein [Acinetobacter qingfengensis]|uniref:DNA-binding protein n=1 Tax=Acinetobacter qingfengensis TaxID=1262585 RepID=A0A1E7QYX1_9GAMM|nr:PLP-dependent aminotransferase family protein [Acinetobacter qingfengensis]KAA8730988.1 PLP-dependent aminotransferase family protein [Acinetobacter qingfengensis]OEY92233.1 DNA-binding protein [Acinetobacter qingfengensis]
MRSLLGDYLLQRLQEDVDGTLHQRLFRCLRIAIVNGILRPQTRLPASRDLAQEIHVSRNTVLSAYEQLQAEGYLEARTGRGTWVAEKIPENYLTPHQSQQNISEIRNKRVLKLSKRGSLLVGYAAASPNQWGAFVPGTPDVTEFPHHIFNRILSKLNREPDVDRLIYSNAGGCFELRSALADYLRVARSIRCDVDQVIITEGIHQATDLVSRTLSDHGDHVWIEDPGYWGVRNTLRVNGAIVDPMPVDIEGIIPDLHPKKPPKLIFVTPSHQYPLGSHLSPDRRKQLLDLARRYGSWIIEDDYDSEFRFSGQPYPALQGLEADAPVIYMGTFSKTIFPALRLGYLVVPKALFSPLRIASAELYRGGHLLTQKAVAEFIREGHYEAHIRRMRLLYGKRRKFLIELIYRYLGKAYLHEFDEEAGLHLVLKLADGCDDVAIASRALERGIYVRPLSQYYMTNHSQAPRGLLLGFACVNEKDMMMAFGNLLQCLREQGIKTLS